MPSTWLAVDERQFPAVVFAFYFTDITSVFLVPGMVEIYRSGFCASSLLPLLSFAFLLLIFSSSRTAFQVAAIQFHSTHKRIRCPHSENGLSPGTAARIVRIIVRKVIIRTDR